MILTLSELTLIDVRTGGADIAAPELAGPVSAALANQAAGRLPQPHPALSFSVAVVR